VVPKKPSAMSITKTNLESIARWYKEVKWAEFFGKKRIVMYVITVTMCLAQSDWDE
jgi:hypothetical protein